MSGEERMERPRRPFEPPYTPQEIGVMCDILGLELRRMFHDELREW
jgi:hypothetical protein